VISKRSAGRNFFTAGRPTERRWLTESARTAPPYVPDGEPAPADGAAPASTAERFKVGQFDVTEAEVGELMAEKAARELRAAQIPPSPADYKIALPENMTLPGNATYRFDEAGNKASFDAAKAWAHGRGMSQADFSEMMGLYASHHAAQEAKIAEVARAELAKAGANAGQRVDAITRWIRAEVGDAEARPIISTLATSSHLKFYERLMTKQISQGVPSFSQKHRDMEPRGISDEQWSKMSYGEKKSYAERASAQQGRR
jgi:hypothetical protein